MKILSYAYVLLVVVSIASEYLYSQKKFLFDATKAETAGNADWVIDEDSSPQRFPTPPESTVTTSTPETYWTGALSSWGIALVRMGHHVETLPSGTAISYGNASNIQDLTNYDVFIVDEPNSPFSAAEKTAMMQFVKNGGGLFMISDHGAADRNNDGWDAVRVWNDLARSNSVQSLPFGMLLDSTNISETTTNILSSPTNEILNGPAGPVTAFKFSNGSTITIDPNSNPTVRALIWQSGYSQGMVKVLVASARYGKGKVVLVGDSSPADDGTGASGNTLYNGWTGDVGASHANLHLNASIWLAEPDTSTTGVRSFETTAPSFDLHQNYPNPFNPTTTIEFTTPNDGPATLKVYNIIGQDVATLFDGAAKAGEYHQVVFNGSRFASGVYFVRVEFGGKQLLKKMLMLK
jgi:hypothetical protein